MPLINKTAVKKHYSGALGKKIKNSQNWLKC